MGDTGGGGVGRELISNSISIYNTIDYNHILPFNLRNNCSVDLCCML